MLSDDAVEDGACLAINTPFTLVLTIPIQIIFLHVSLKFNPIPGYYNIRERSPVMDPVAAIMPRPSVGIRGALSVSVN